MAKEDGLMLTVLGCSVVAEHSYLIRPQITHDKSIHIKHGADYHIVHRICMPEDWIRGMLE
ncbi:Uncharacterized protein APZ42_015400 [Daphnia magna]|uniref:Uncharacterized protein n=1 Tax=Daphnia magna TaxID=35525 RepID=A0A162PG01_9CRUS|nr:Uncharacterized protein APZ42_015400 [Daphnia magna]